MSDLFMEISQTAWQVSDGVENLEFPLERTENGRLSDACRERVTAGLRNFVNKKGWRPRRRAWVALGARGVSLRRLALPPAPKDELPRLLRLQIESEFPLPPDELAWGWQLLGQNPARQEVLVAAAKREMIAPYAEILAACGLAPLFTVAALARSVFTPPPLPSCAVLHVGPAESELLSFQDGAPCAIRLLPWGAESAEPLPPGCLNPKSLGGQLYLTGPGARHASVASRLAQCLGNATSWPVLDSGAGTERFAAMAGLKKSAAGGGALLAIHLDENRNGSRVAETWTWAAACAALLLALLCFPYVFPYAEALVLQPYLAKKLAAIETDRVRLPAIDHELDFLQYLKRSQPPYLDTIYLISKIAPPGTSFESLAMTRRGEFSVRGKLANAQQVTEFRSNLVQSAWFSSVVVEEQTPTPDRQVSIRMTAQVKPVDARKPLVVETNSATPPK